MLQVLDRLVGSYGYVVVALIIILECLGMPLPGETTLLVAAAYAGAGVLRLPYVIAVAAMSAIVGDAGGYWIGRWGGRPFLERAGGWLHLNQRKLRRIEAFFEQHGPKAVFFGRFVGVIRTYVAVMAGVSRMPYARFAIFNVLGGIVWAITFGLLGYAFGQNIGLVEHWVKLLGRGMLIIAVLVGGGILMWKWLATHQKEISAKHAAWERWPRIAALRQRYARQREWIAARLTPGQRLGLHFTLGVFCSVLLLWIFVGLAEDVINNEPLAGLDLTISATLHAWATPAATAVFVLITDLATPVTIGVLVVLVTLLHALRRQWLHVLMWLVTVVGGEALSQLLKSIFARPRPVFEYPLLLARGFSFPSGHAMSALLLYGMLAYFAILRLRSWSGRSAVVVGTAVLVLLIGISRLYLGMHFLSDVIAGYAAAGVWLSTCITAMEGIRRGDFRGSWLGRLQRLHAADV